LEKLGIDAKEFSKVNMDEQMIMLAAALEKIPDPQERITLAFESLGSKAKVLFPMLLGGTEEMEKFFQKTAVASDEAVKKLDEAGDRLTAAKNAAIVFSAETLNLNDKIREIDEEKFARLFKIIVDGASDMNQAFASLLKGDLQGAWGSLGAMIENAKNNVIEYGNELKKIIFGEGEAPQSPDQQAAIDAAEAQNAAAEDRAALEERIAQIRADHAEKALEAETRLAHLVEQRKALEEELANTSADSVDRRKELSDQIVKNEQAQLSTQDEIAKIQEKAGEEQLKQLNKEAEEYDKALKKKAEVDSKERDNLAKISERNEKLAERKKMDDFRERERDLGFVSGIKEVGDSRSGQRLAGVDYSVINAEAEKGIKLQEEMRNYMKIIAEKEYTLEIPDAS